jgi:glycine cleavage system aminomethyltransferase T
MPTALLRSPLHTWQQAHGARFADSDGWQTVTGFMDVEKETTAAKSGLALADLSSFAKFEVRGPGVAEWVQHLGGDGAARRPLGVSLVGNCVLACRTAMDHVILLGSDSAFELRHPQGDLLCSGLRFHVANEVNLHVINQTSTLAGFSLSGPNVDALLRHLTHLDAPPSDSCVQTRLAGVVTLLVRSQELTVPSLRIYVNWELGEYLWERLLEAGGRWGLQAIGLETWRALYSERV